MAGRQPWYVFSYVSIHVCVCVWLCVCGLARVLGRLLACLHVHIVATSVRTF